MKKSIKTTLLGSAAVLMSVSLAACGNSNADNSTKKDNAPKTEKVRSKESKIESSSSADSSAISSSESSSSEASSMSSKMSSSSSSAVSAKNLTPQQLGILVAMNQNPDLLQSLDSTDEAIGLWYASSNQESSAELAGFDAITTHGDGTANLYYKLDGNNVIIKKMDPNSGDCVADEKLMTLTVPVSQLMQNYSTPQQQSQVNNDANKLRNN